MRLYSHPNSDDIWGTKYPGMGTYNNVCPGICNMHTYSFFFKGSQNMYKFYTKQKEKLTCGCSSNALVPFA